MIFTISRKRHATERETDRQTDRDRERACALDTSVCARMWDADGVNFDRVLTVTFISDC